MLSFRALSLSTIRFMILFPSFWTNPKNCRCSKTDSFSSTLTGDGHEFRARLIKTDNNRMNHMFKCLFVCCLKAFITWFYSLFGFVFVSMTLFCIKFHLISLRNVYSSQKGAQNGKTLLRGRPPPDNFSSSPTKLTKNHNNPKLLKFFIFSFRYSSFILS